MATKEKSGGSTGDPADKERSAQAVNTGTAGPLLATEADAGQQSGTGQGVTQHPGFVRPGDVGADGNLAVGTQEVTPPNEEHPAGEVPVAPV